MIGEETREEGATQETGDIGMRGEEVTRGREGIRDGQIVVRGGDIRGGLARETGESEIDLEELLMND